MSDTKRNEAIEKLYLLIDKIPRENNDRLILEVVDYVYGGTFWDVILDLVSDWDMETIQGLTEKILPLNNTNEKADVQDIG